MTFFVSSSSDNDVDVWKRLWKLPVVPRCVSFGGEFFEVFYLIIGLCHGDI
jgi:hypothetical protein